MEEFDLVDKDDNVVGVTDKETAHQFKQIHRIVAVYVFNDKGELFVQVHKKGGGLYDHSVGGHVARGETYESAVYREAKEELGIDQPLSFVSKYYSDEGIHIHMIAVYECIADKSWKFVPNDEVEEIIPMKVEDIRELMKSNRDKFTGGFVSTMEEYCRIKNI
jgi:isopentenyldiphosphate isomerase